MTANNVMTEACNLQNMVTAQTLLLSQENTPLHTMTDGRTGFKSAMPCHSIAFTPNLLTTPLHQHGPYDPSQIPCHSITFTPNPLATPLHQCGPYNPSQTPHHSIAIAPKLLTTSLHLWGAIEPSHRNCHSA